MSGGTVRTAGIGLAGLGGATVPRELGTGLRSWFLRELAQEFEHRRLFPWLAVTFGAGALTCLCATEGMPARWAPLAIVALVAALLPFLRTRPVATACVFAFLSYVLGFAAAAFRLEAVAGPVLARTTIAQLTGLVESLDERENGARLIIRVHSFGALEPAALPRRVRVSHAASTEIRPGDYLVANARLLPPPEAARPGGYDFARDAFFRGIGAVGSLTGSIAIRSAPEPVPWSLRLAALVDEARNALTRRIVAANGGQAGAVAAALVTGKRGLISEPTNAVLRAAGIYHVVSISGLHMVLAAGVVFWLVRAVLALVPALALAWPLKKIAALCAMLGVTAYCVFSGWDVAAGRALIMTLIMLGAILVDRPALSMRNLAIAAVLALAREPEALLGPSFQMSFGAVAGLIASAPLLERLRPGRETAGWFGRTASGAARAVLVTLATTAVAQLATAPFATFHFQTVQPFGLLGNALTLPLVSLAVMPSAVVGVLAYPFALDQPVWWAMGQAVRGMLAISAWIAGLGQANLVVPSFGPSALILFGLALLLAAVIGSSLRLLAVLPAVAGLAAALLTERNDIFVDREGTGLAVRGTDGKLAVLGRPSSFVLEQWLRADGDGRSTAQVLADRAGRCDALGCTIRARDGRWVAFVADKRAFAEDCSRADLVVSRLQAPPGCDALVVVDRRFLARNGATTIRLTPGWPTMASVRDPDRTPAWRAALAASMVRPVSRPVEAVLPVGDGGDGSGDRPDRADEPGPALSTDEPD